MTVLVENYVPKLPIQTGSAEQKATTIGSPLSFALDKQHEGSGASEG